MSCIGTEKKLFSDLRNENPTNWYGYAATKRFGDTLRPQLGYEKGEGYCFHSLKKNVIQNFQQKLEITREIRKSLVGRSVGGRGGMKSMKGRILHRSCSLTLTNWNTRH